MVTAFQLGRNEIKQLKVRARPALRRSSGAAVGAASFRALAAVGIVLRTFALPLAVGLLGGAVWASACPSCGVGDGGTGVVCWCWALVVGVALPRLRRKSRLYRR